MKPVIFLGPSLPLAEAQAILPDAIYLPPAGQGDLMSAVTTYRPKVLGLIDGVFHQELSVWHKEVLFALDEGVQVYGSSSMGALRAAETAAFGCIGVGEVFRMFDSGELEDDDEVALSYAEEDGLWRPSSVPMVNLRATFQAARDAGVLTSEQCEQVVGIAKAMYFPDRSIASIVHGAAGQLDEKVLADLRSFAKDHFVDLKKGDAIELLELVRDTEPSPPKVEFTFTRTGHFNTLFNRDRSVQRNGTDVPLEEIGNYAALNDPTFDSRNFHALNRMLGVVLADLVGVTTVPEEVTAERARFMRERNLADDDALQLWMQANDTFEAEFAMLMSEIALCRKLHRWFVIANWMERTTRISLNEMRLEGVYEQWADKAAAQEQFLESEGLQMGDPTIRLADLVAEHEKWTGRKLPRPVEDWMDEAGFHTTGNLSAALASQGRVRASLLKMLAAASPSE
ncbi:MAG: TfuA-like protein [Actinomycetota bacterium]|nr:TfuA-like protein [Actinomycetota bacterium]